MAWVVLCKEDGLWAMLPERSGGDAYGLRRLDAATANSAEALAAVAAVASGSACVVDLQRYEAAVGRLSHGELVQAVTGSALLGGSGRLLTGLLPALQQCSQVVAGVPTLPAAVVNCSITAFNSCSGSSGSSSGGSGSDAGDGGSGTTAPSMFELMHLLSKHSVQGSASRHLIQFDGAPEEQQLRRQRQQQALPVQSPLAPPAAALAAGGAELWVRWGDAAGDWCLFRQGPGEWPCVRCSCGFAGYGLLFCEHLASAYSSFVAPSDVAASSGSNTGSIGSSGSAASSAAPVALDVAALEAACAELDAAQLSKLLLCTVLYTGAGGVLLDGLGLKPADLWPLGGAGLAPEAAAFLTTRKPSTYQIMQASGVQIGPYGLPVLTAQPDRPPGCSMGSWRAAVPAAAGPVGCGTIPLLQHAALQLPPPSAEGVWLAMGMSTGLTGLPLSRSGHPNASEREPSGRQLLQAARLLLDEGHLECGRHLLQEWVVALSLAPAWPANVDDWRPRLVQLWRGYMPAAAQLEWWMCQLAGPGSGACPYSLSQQQQRLSAICSTDYIKLIEELMGPVAAAQLASALLDGLSRACSRGAARFATGQANSSYSITDLQSPAPQAATWLSSAEAAGMGFACIREHLLPLLEIYLTQKAPQHAADQQPNPGRRKVKRRGQQGSAAGGQGAAGGQQGQGPQLPPRSVGEAPTLLRSAARGMAERLLALPLDQAMQLFDGLVPDLEPIVLEEIAGLQAQQLRMLQTDLPTLIKQARQGLPLRQPAADGQAAAAAAAGPSAAAPAAGAGGQQAQHAQQAQQAQQVPLRLQDLLPNQRDSVVDQLLNTFPPAARAGYRQAPRAALAQAPFMQTLFEARRAQLRVPPPAGAGAAAGAAAGQRGSGAPLARGLLELLEAAAAPQPASSKQRLTYAACYCAEQLAHKHGWAAMQQLEAEGGAGWRHLVTLLEQAQPQYSRCSYDLLPAVLAAVAYLFVDAKHTPSKSQQRKQRQGAGAQRQQQAAKVPAEVVVQLVTMLPGLLEACCDSAREALHGASSASSSGGGSGSGGAPGCPAGGAADAEPSGGAEAVSLSNRSVVADRDALALALSGIHNCLKLSSSMYTGDWPSCLSMHHTATLSRLRRLMPAALVRAASVLLETAVAADQAAAETHITLYMTVQHDWTVEAERAAAALLPLLPWTIPDAADAHHPGTSAAAAAAAAASDSLLSLRPQLLAAAAALQRVRFSSPVRRCSLALACRCLQAAAMSQAVPAAERQQAADALLRLVLSPASAGELHPTDLMHADTQLLMECALGAAAAVLQGGSSAGGLGGELAYLAINLLAHCAGFTDVRALTGDPPAALGSADSRAKVAPAAAKHSGWQLAALQVVEWWQGRAAADKQMAGSPPPLFCASTLLALLLRAWEPSVQAAAVAALRRLAAADPLLLLQCDSLPLLAHLAHKQAYWSHGSRQLQDAVYALSRSVQAAAAAAGRAEQHMWPVWGQHPPATSSAAAEAAKQRLDPFASATTAGGSRADPWDRVTARMNVLQAVGRGGASGSGTAARARAAAASAGVPGGTYGSGMSHAKAVALQNAAMRSAAAELLDGDYYAGYPYGRIDPYTGEPYTEDEDDSYEDEDYYDYFDEEGMPLGDYW